jgi:hypothetical protein
MRTEIFVFSLLLPLSAAACGFCIEDRVAAVYDQATVEEAVKQKRYVAFFGIEGEAHAVSPRALAAALEGAGAVRGATKVSIHDHACAVVYDPKRTTMRKLADAAAKSLSSQGVTLTALRVIDASGKLSEPAP